MTLDEILNKVGEQEEVKRKEKTEHGGDERVLNLQKGVTYVGRFVLATTDPANESFKTYEEVGWNSRVTGAYTNAGRSPSDLKIKDDVITTTKWDEYNKAKAIGKEKALDAPFKLLNSRRKQITNFYLAEVIGDDAKAKEKIGTVVVLRYPAQLDYKTGLPSSDLYKLIQNGIGPNGENRKKIGKKAFDLTKNGRSLKIKVTDKGGFNNYAESSFTDGDDDNDLKLTAAQIEALQQSSHDLNEFVPEVKSKEELLKILNEHYFGTSTDPDEEVDNGDSDESDDDDEIPGLESSSTGSSDLDDLLK